MQWKSALSGRALRPTLLLLALAWMMPAGAQIFAGDFSRETTVAWSKSGLELAVRTEELAHDSETGEPRTTLQIQLRSCRETKPRKTFAILGEGKQSKKDRAAGWKAAERWLREQEFLFVAGKNAKEIPLEMMETREVKPGAQNLPVPKRLAPDPKSWAQLMIGKDDAGVTVYAAYTLPTSEKVQGGKLAEVRHGGISADTTVCEVQWGPEARCAALVCKGSAELGNERGYLKLLDARELEKLWTFERP